MYTSIVEELYPVMNTIVQTYSWGCQGRCKTAKVTRQEEGQGSGEKKKQSHSWQVLYCFYEAPEEHEQATITLFPSKFLSIMGYTSLHQTHLIITD